MQPGGRESGQAEGVLESRRMTREPPRDLSRRKVASLLATTKGNGSAGDRIEVLSRQFLRHPYRANALIGSASTPEVFTASLDGFDCVTYLETVLALSRASKVEDFVDWLRRIRYAKGRVEWRRRNHYMTGWIRNNTRDGIVRRVRTSAPAIVKERKLDVLPGLPPVRVRFACVPKGSAPRLVRRLQTGDLVFFASTRKHLDVFHCGILVRTGDTVRLRHASRSRGAVVEQDLTEFMRNNRMAGVIVVRPTEERPS
jgi:cell wall-associated NlpC family hydrolase